jgi:hypothetical protein
MKWKKGTFAEYRVQEGLLTTTMILVKQRDEVRMDTRQGG